MDWNARCKTGCHGDDDCYDDNNSNKKIMGNPLYSLFKGVLDPHWAGVVGKISVFRL